MNDLTRSSPTNAPPSAATGVECPRCAYDLRGTTTSWKESCPMTGRCAECGLEFTWFDIFNRPLHPWLFEHQWRRRPLRSALLTMLTPIGGRRIGREITIMHPIRLAPLVGLLAALVLVTFAVRVFIAYDVARQLAPLIARWGGGPGNLLDDTTERLRYDAVFALLFVAPVLLLPPVVFLAIPASLRKVKVRRRHIIRIWLYWLIAAAFVAMLLAVAQAVSIPITGSVPPTWLQPAEWEFFSVSYGNVLFTMIRMTVAPIWSIVMLWALIWWWFACRNYLRLPDATLTATLLMTLVLISSYLIPFFASQVLGWT